MSLLSIDTATEILSVGIETTEGFFETSISAGFRHSEYLLPAVDALTKLTRTEEQLELVVCMRGPGSFTGLRIGMATAKGLAAGARCDIVAVPTLDTLAWGAEYFPGHVVPVIDARKQRVYAAVYQSGKKQTEDLDVAPAELEGLLPQDSPVLFTGPGAALLSEAAARHSHWKTDPRATASRAYALLLLGKRRLSEVGPDPKDLGPVYLRKSEAQLGMSTKKG